MKRFLFWRLFILLTGGGVIIFSLVHSAAMRHDEKMSYIDKSHQQQILDWGTMAQTLLNQGDMAKLHTWLTELSVRENTWATVINSQVESVAGNQLNARFWQGYGFGRDVTWKIHLYFPENPIMEVSLVPDHYHFLIVLPQRMRPSSHTFLSFWFYRALIPFITFTLLCWYLYRKIMLPLSQLNDANQKMSQGNFSVRISHPSLNKKDEFGRVAETFNLMAERTSTLVEYNRNLIADMSHEMRTPLTRIEVALDCINNGIDRDKMLERIQSEVGQMKTLSEDTLALAWLENESPNLRMESFDLCELVQTIIEDARFEYPDRYIQLSAPEHGLYLINSNQRALWQAIENIVRNGLRYTEIKKSLVVTIKKSNDSAIVSIIDTGPGISVVQKEKIFMPFFKSDNQISSRKGFGVGLALAKRHIEAIKGTVDVLDNPQGGLIFTVVLPLQ